MGSDVGAILRAQGHRSLISGNVLEAATGSHPRQCASPRAIRRKKRGWRMSRWRACALRGRAGLAAEPDQARLPLNSNFAKCIGQPPLSALRAALMHDVASVAGVVKCRRCRRRPRRSVRPPQASAYLPRLSASRRRVDDRASHSPDAREPIRIRIPGVGASWRFPHTACASAEGS
jgi:hypothetical protein